jgi:ribosomal protein L17
MIFKAKELEKVLQELIVLAKKQDIQYNELTLKMQEALSRRT